MIPAVQRPSVVFGELTTAATAEMVGMRDPITFQPRVFTGETGTFRSAAAHAIEARYFNGVPNWSATSHLQLVHRDWLVKNPLNPRRYSDRQKLLDLLNSVSTEGVHKPLDISKHPETGKAYILSGHRRLWAIEMNGLELIPCRLDPRGVLSELEMREALIRYNEGEEKPAPIDRARSLFEFIEVSKLPKVEVAARAGISMTTMLNLLGLLTLPEDVQNLVNTSQLQLAVAYEIVRHPGGPNAQRELARRAMAESLTPNQTKLEVRRVRSASALAPDRHSPQHRSEKWVDRVKKVEIKVSGPNPVRLTVSSHKAELTSGQIRSALHEAIMTYPIELPDNHWQPSANGAFPALSSVPASTSPLNATRESSTPIEVPLRQPPLIGKFKNGAADSTGAEFLSGIPEWDRTDAVQLISRAALVPHPLNPRKLVNQEMIETTLRSIATVGIHTPFAISRHPSDPNKAYVIGGHRRLWCATKLGLDLVPCRLDSRGVLTNVQVREALFRDNEGQEKPNPIDRAKSFRDYLLVSCYSVEEAARRLGIPAPLISKLLRLLDLPEPVQQLVNEGKLNETVALAIREHPGGPQAQIALGHKAVARDLSAAQIRKFYGNREIKLSTELDVSHKVDGTTGYWNVGGDLRILITLNSDGHHGKQLTREQILASLQSGLDQVARDEGIIVSTVNEVEVEEQRAENTAPKAKERLVAIDTVAVDEANILAFSQAAKKYIAAVVEQMECLMIPEPYAQLLRRTVTNSDMKRMKITDLETTAIRAAKYHKVTDVTDPVRVTLAQVFDWNAAAEKWLMGLPSTKKLLREEEARGFPLDIEMGRGMINRADALRQIQARLKAIGKFLSDEGEMLMQSDDLTTRHGSMSSKDNPTFTADQLTSAGVKLHSSLRWYISRWKRNVQGIANPTGTTDRFNFSELHGYFTHALRELLTLTGGQTVGRVGRKEISNRLIAFSQNVPGRGASMYGAQSIYNELRANIEKVNELYQAHERARDSAAPQGEIWGGRLGKNHQHNSPGHEGASN